MGDLTDDSGWKQVRGDVFRAPPRLVLLAALLGTGYQLLFLVFSVILLALIADFYEEYVHHLPVVTMRRHSYVLAVAARL